MTVTLMPDPLAESQRLIAVLERNIHTLPFAPEHLAIHRAAHELLLQCQRHSDAAVAAWRSALARRWQCEIAARRLHKQIERQYCLFYGSAEYPEVRRIASSHDDTHPSPLDLLADLRRMVADLTLHSDSSFVERQSKLQHACDQLDTAIYEAATCEAIRRTAVLERRMAQEAFRRARINTQRAFCAFYGAQLAPDLSELFA